MLSDIGQTETLNVVRRVAVFLVVPFIWRSLRLENTEGSLNPEMPDSHGETRQKGEVL
jgi:hypothetical protein